MVAANDPRFFTIHKGIVIGAGQSFFEQDDLKRLSIYNLGGDNPKKFDGEIVVAERIAWECIELGIDPYRFKFNVVSCEDMSYTGFDMYERFFSKILPYAKVITVWVGTNTEPKLVKWLKENFPDVHTFDRRFSGINAPRDKHTPLIECCGNCGMACWSIARTQLGCENIAVLGFDFEIYSKDTSLAMWDTELNQSLKTVKDYSFECVTFNLSEFGRFENDQINRCSLEQFLTDTYIPKNNPNENMEIVE